MHILYLQQLLILPDSPGNTRSWEFARQWWESGWDISICTTHAHLKGHPDYPHPQKFPYVWDYMGLSIYVFDVEYSHMMPFSRRVRAFLAFYRKVLKERDLLPEVDAVLAYTAPLSVAELGRKLAQKLEVPFFLEVGDVWPDVPIAMGVIRQRWLISWLKKRTKKIYDAASHIFPFSPDMKTQIMEAGVDGGKITPVVNGTQVSYNFNPAMLVHPKGKIHLLYAGTIGIANDLGQLMDAMSMLEGSTKLDVQLDVVGNGNEAEKVMKKAKDLGLKKVHFHQEVNRFELKKYWEQAHIGIVCFKAIPALQANGATKFFDYLAAGIPVVINYQGWQADYLRKYNCGMSSEQGDAAAFARNLIFLVTYPTVRMRMGGNAKRLAQSLFDRQLLAKEMQDMLEKNIKEVNAQEN